MRSSCMSERLIRLDRGPTRPTESVKIWRNLMKTLVAGLMTGLVLTMSSAVEAHGHRGHGHGYGWHRSYNPGWWVAPALISGAVVYAATRPDPVIVQQPTLVLQPNQVIIDGVLYTKQIMIVNGIQQEVLVRQ